MVAARRMGVGTFFSVIISLSFSPLPATAGVAPGLARGGRGFLKRGASHAELLERELKLQQLFQDIRVSDKSGRVRKIEAKLAPIFQALPKNSMGRLAPRATRFLVHHYFMLERGWMLTGLEAHGHQQDVSEVHQVAILKEKAPALAGALSLHRAMDQGLSLDDIVTLAAALEQMVVDTSMDLLSAAYYLNGLSTTDAMDERTLHEVLFSFLISYEMGESRNVDDVEEHREMRERAEQEDVEVIFDDLWTFQNDTVKSKIYADRGRINPFKEARYSFQDTMGFVTELVEGYSGWQDQECRRMREHLVAMSVPGTGLIPLATFYSEEGSDEYRFSESKAYLEAVGALDAKTQSVRIANYLNGPSNCLASSSSLAVCCLNECDRLMHELMVKTQAPVADPEDVLRIVGNMSSANSDEQVISPEMQRRLQAIAESHDGAVQLHSRRFALWMHNAFPNECSFPHVVHNASALTMQPWKDGSSTATEQEISEIIKDEEVAPVPFQPEAPVWDEDADEVFPLEEPLPLETSSGVSRLVRIGVQIAMLGVGVRMATAWWRAARQACASDAGRTKAGAQKPVMHSV